MKKIAAGITALGGLLAAMPAFAGLKGQIEENLAYGKLTGLGSRDIRTVIMLIINVILGFLAVVAVVLVVWGGFKWMTAAGNEDQIDEAKKLIVAGIVGLAIIFSSYGIAIFVVRSLVNVTGN